MPRIPLHELLKLVVGEDFDELKSDEEREQRLKEVIASLKDNPNEEIDLDKYSKS